MKSESVSILTVALRACIFGPGGDPIYDTLIPGVFILKTIIIEGHLDDLEKDLLEECIEIFSPGGNIEQADYLKEQGLDYLRER